MSKQQFEVFHHERYTGRKVVDSQMPIVGKDNAVVFATFLFDESRAYYHSSRREGRKLPLLYYIRNLKTGRIMDYEGKNSKALGKDMSGIDQNLA